MRKGHLTTPSSQANNAGRSPLSATKTLTSFKTKYNIVVPAPRNPPQHPLIFLQQLPIPLRFVLYICILNCIWLVFFSSHHLDQAQNHQLVSGSRSLRQALSSFTTRETVLVVIVSNRFKGILPTVSSILTHTTSKPIDLVLIGDHAINQQVKEHFMNQPRRSDQGQLHKFTSLTVADVQQDLLDQGYKPIWTWPEWGSSRSLGWRNENTLHTAEWDKLETHAHELNHLRFYLPHMRLFHDRSSFYFLDDDILVRKDLGHAADATLATLSPERGFVTPCNIWIWNSQCHHFGFQDELKIGPILKMPSLYGDRDVCRSDSEMHCYPESYPDFLESVLPKTNVTNRTTIINNNPKDQKAWNFGFSLFALDHWRSLGLTERYEAVMKESYRRHVFPETSLTFGLGVAYLAFAGAVECWKDDDMRVRDGFGFIEWNRYEQTFGKGFFDKVDVLHYTGPHKPWDANTTIEPRVLEPWLHHMQEEKMPLPDQLPTEPTKNLFVLLASDRTGAQWMMNTLDMHPAICATGEGDKPESGFPTEALLPDGVTWEPVCSVKRGCTYQFVHDHILELAETLDSRGRNGLVPARCHPDHDVSNDPLQNHLPRLCNFLQALHRNFTDANIEKVWVEAFRDENPDFMACTCQRGTTIKGLKVLGEWLTYQNFPFHETGPATLSLANTPLNGSKVIRLRRRNFWAQYKSFRLAQESSLFHLSSVGDKHDQLAKAGNVTINIEDMLTKLLRMNATDEFADKWAQRHGMDVLHVTYEDCREDTKFCFENIFRFLEVDSSLVQNQKQRFESLFAEFKEIDKSLDNIANQGAVKEALANNGWGHFVDLKDYHELHLLIYDETETVTKTHQFHEEKGIRATIFGQHIKSDESTTKFADSVPLLRSLHPNTLVVLSDNWDVRIRFPTGNDFMRYEAIHRFRLDFEEITRHLQGAVVVSSESHCCAGALTHSRPGQYFQEDGRRMKRACQSGLPGCEWAGDEKAWPWQMFMQELALQRSPTPTDDMYLDASLIAGKAGDLLRLIATLNLHHEEDDRAVLTDYMYLNPDAIILDYEQRLFGKNREGFHAQTNQNCPFTPDVSADMSRRLDNTQNSSASLFVHTPRDLGCALDKQMEVSPIFPKWDINGIDIEPIISHISRVAEAKSTIVYPHSDGSKVDYSQGPEIPYYVDEKGVWTSRLIRDRTDALTMKWRTEPTEGLIRKAFSVLTGGDSDAEQRWDILLPAVRSGGFPFWTWYGDYKTCNYHNHKNDSIPLLTPAVPARCTHAFPIPNYMNIFDSQKNTDHWRGLLRDNKVSHPWEEKIRKVVWRGSLSEANWKEALTSVRWRANVLIHDLRSDSYDVGLTSIPPWVSDYIDIDVSLVGGFASNISPMSNFQNYMAILDMDGNSWSSRFATLLCYNSVVIKVEAEYVEYFYKDLKPWTHYIPVKNDLSDLDENVAWALDSKNSAIVQDIINSANEWCSQRMIPDELAKDLLDIWQAYVRLLNRNSDNWQSQWLESKAQLLEASDLNFLKI